MAENSLTHTLANMNFGAIGNELSTADSILDRVSPMWEGLSKIFVPTLVDAADNAQDARDWVTAGNNNIKEEFMPMSDLAMEMRGDSEGNIEQLKNTFNSNLEKQGDQYVINDLISSFTGKPPAKLDPFYMDLPYVSDNPNVEAVTLNMISPYSPRNVFVRDDADPIQKILNYRHEDDHSRFPERGEQVIQPNKNLLLSDLDPSYYGQRTEVSARLAELEAINDMMKVDSMMELKTRGRRRGILEEINPFIDGYRKLFPDDNRTQYFDKWKGSLR